MKPSPKAVFQGKVVDVSAGGVRAAFPARASFARGQRVRFELSVGDERQDPAPVPVRLKGEGTVLRVVPLSSGGDQEVALAFQAPLSFFDGFPGISVF